MNIQKQWRTNLTVTVLILFIFISIILFQSYFNLQNILIGPSESWGRSIQLESRLPFKKTPSIILADNIADILIANGTKFDNVVLDRKTGEYSIKDIQIENAEIQKTAQVEWGKDIIFWTENFTLFYSVKEGDGSFSPKVLLKDHVKSIKLISSGDVHNLAVACENEIFLYEAVQGQIKQLGEKIDFPQVEGVSLVKDNNGVLHIAAYADSGSAVFPVRYYTYANDSVKLIAESNEESFSRTLSKIDIGLDNSTAYIFCQFSTWNNRGVSSAVSYAVLPIHSDGNTLNFEKLYLSEEEKHSPSVFMMDPICTKQQQDKLYLAVLKDTYDIKTGEGYCVYVAEWNNGNLIAVNKATGDRGWLSNISIQANNTGVSLAYLEPAGKAKSDVFYADSSEAYRKAVSKINKQDIFYASIEIIPGFVTGSLLALIKSLIYFPAALWLLIVEIFEIRRFRRHPILVRNVAIGIFVLIKLFTLGGYYTEYSTALMPDVMKFAGAQYVYAAVTLFLSYLLMTAFKKNRPEMHYIPQFLVFAYSDVIITTLLYTTYML